MDFELNETQKLFKRSAREFLASECPPAALREMIENDAVYSEALWAKLVEQGWTGLIIPEDIGGLGLGWVEMAVAFEEMGYALAPGPFLSTAALAGSLLQKAGSSVDHLRRICDGSAKATVALLGEEVGWELNGAGVEAAPSSDGLRLKGRRVFVSDAGVSDLIITPVVAGSEMVLAAVHRDSPGLEVTRMPSLDATRHLYNVNFNGTPLAEDDLLARGDAARTALDFAVDAATICLSAEMVGGMQWMLDSAVEYAKTRKQFGRPIGQFQAVQHHCSDMLLMTESARSAVYYAAWTMGSRPEQAPLAVSVAKSYASDAYREVGNLGIQTLGGIGFTWDHDIHFYYKRAKASELMFGDATFHRERIARLVIDRGAGTLSSAQSGD